jgi:arylsulfatase A-like enzyme
LTRNVILIVSDSLRRDHLGCYGNNWIHTPNLDRLAESSLVFDHAYVHNFPTVPARTDYYTGRYTSAYLDWQPLPPNERVIAEVLGQADITTYLVGDTYNLFRDGYNFDRGFTGFEWIRGNGADRWQSNPKSPTLPAPRDKLFDVENYLIRYLRNASVRGSEEDFASPRTMRRAAEWLRTGGTEAPFFLHVDTFDPHEPWDPPLRYVELYDPGYSGDQIIHPRYDAIDYLTPAELRHCRALYAAEVTMVDTWVGHLLRTVEALGLLDNTVIIFTSDHGFYLGEHGYIGKTSIVEGGQHFLPLYEELAHVPLMVYAPGLRPGRTGALVQPVDIAPTIYELMGVEAPGTTQGESWVTHLRDGVPMKRVFTWSGPAVHHRGRWRPSTITAGDWALIFNGPVDEPAPEWEISAVDGAFRRETVPTSRSSLAEDEQPQLFHLASDPQQQRNVYRQYPEIAKHLHGQYVVLLERLGVPENALELRRVL